MEGQEGRATPQKTSSAAGRPLFKSAEMAHLQPYSPTDSGEDPISENHGDLKAAKRFYQSAREGFNDAGELRYFGLVSVDLMTIHAQQGEWEIVGDLASKTLPILGSLSLHSETVAAVGLLAEPIEAGTLSCRLLKDLRVALRQDPLAM